MARDLGLISQSSTNTPALERPNRAPADDAGLPGASIPGSKPTSLGSFASGVANFFTGGTQAAGQDIASAIAAPTASKAANNIADSDIQYLNTLLKFKKDAEKNGQDTSHWDNLIQNYKPQNVSEDASKIAPALDKSNGQVLGDFGQMGLELAGGASLPGKGMIAGQLARPLTKAPTLVTAAKAGIDAIGAGTAKAAEKNVANVAAKGAQKASDFALDLTAPKLSVAEKGAAISGGRSTSPGILKAAKILPTAHDQLVADSVRDIVEPGNIFNKNNVVKNVDAIRARIDDINSGVKALIADNKIPFNEAQLRSKLKEGADDLKLVFASDATAERTYKAVVDTFLDTIGKKDTAGLFQARQEFDKIPAIKKLLDSSAIGENARKQIVLEVRRAANDYVAEQLPKNNPYRAALQQESRMIEALGNIGDKESGTIGLNKIQELTKKYPVLNWLIGGVATGIAGGAGIGVGRAIVSSSD